MWAGLLLGSGKMKHNAVTHPDRNPYTEMKKKIYIKCLRRISVCARRALVYLGYVFTCPWHRTGGMSVHSSLRLKVVKPCELGHDNPGSVSILLFTEEIFWESKRWLRSLRTCPYREKDSVQHGWSDLCNWTCWKNLNVDGEPDASTFIWLYNWLTQWLSG